MANSIPLSTHTPAETQEFEQIIVINDSSSDEEGEIDRTIDPSSVITNPKASATAFSECMNFVFPTSPITVKLFYDFAEIPRKATSSAAGFDLYSIGCESVDVGDVIKIKTGIALQIPRGYFGQIVNRSGNVMISNLMVISGIIDSDYRGEICVMMFNFGKKGVTVRPHTRVAQLIIQKHHPCSIIQLDEFFDSREIK